MTELQKPIFSPRNRGFTLIELMVVLVVVLLLLMAAAPSLRSWIAEPKGQNAAGASAQAFRLARTNAIARGLSVKATVNTANGNWGVACLNPIDLNANGSEDPGDCLLSKSGTVQELGDYSISTVPSGRTSVTFNGNGMLNQAQSNLSEIRFTTTAPNARNFRVVVNNSGQISVQCSLDSSFATGVNPC